MKKFLFVLLSFVFDGSIFKFFQNRSDFAIWCIDHNIGIFFGFVVSICTILSCCFIYEAAMKLKEALL